MKSSLVFLLMTVLMFSIPPPSRAQDVVDTVEVGVVEHLDKVIPDNLVFRDETNTAVNLKQIIRKPTILSLVYFDCPGICPQLLAGVANAVKRSGLQLGKDFQIVTISFNPLDTPDKAMDKKQQFLDAKTRPYASDWKYLTGDSAAIRELTNAVGYKFISAGNDFIHPSVVIILSPEGKITRYLYGTTFLPFDIKMAVIEAQKGISRPTINRILDFCFNYDPAGRRYVLAVTKISATIIITIALLLFGGLLINSSRKRKKIKES